MRSDRRLIRLLIVLALIALPALVLTLACAGNACVQREAKAATAPEIPFCGLPAEIRTLVAQGYREGRSGDILAVSELPAVSGQLPEEPTGTAPIWPSLESGVATRVPVVFAGPGVPKRPLPAGDTDLADVGPTIAKLGRITWPFPQYRQGIVLPGFEPPPDRTPLIVVVAWKGLGSDDLATDATAWPSLRALMRGGSGTLDATTGSLPVDSTAALTTIGTGGVPSSHGITGTLIRNEDGALVQAWSDDAPVSVIAGIGDTIDEKTGDRAKVGLVATEPFDRGLIGGNWYFGRDDDDVRIVPTDRAARTASALLAAEGFGTDGVPDLLGVTLDGPIGEMDRATGEVAEAARAATGGRAVVVVVGTGSGSDAERPGAAASLTGSAVAEAADAAAGTPVVEAATGGELFLDQQVMADAAIPQGRLVDGIDALRIDGEPVMADVFPAFAVSFGRYCS